MPTINQLISDLLSRPVGERSETIEVGDVKIEVSVGEDNSVREDKSENIVEYDRIAVQLQERCNLRDRFRLELAALEKDQVSAKCALKSKSRMGLQGRIDHTVVIRNRRLLSSRCSSLYLLNHWKNLPAKEKWETIIHIADDKVRNEMKKLYIREHPGEV